MASELVCVKDYQKAAETKLSSYAHAYFNHGAYNEDTYRDNSKSFKREERGIVTIYALIVTMVMIFYLREAWNEEKVLRSAHCRYKFRPQYMRDVSSCFLSTTVLGHMVSCPIGVSPMAMCTLAHPDGEVGIAQACSSMGMCFTLSTSATTGLEEIGEKVPDCLRWFQIHILTDRNMLTQLVRKAERAGFTALALTVDCHVHGRRHAEMRNFAQVPRTYKLGVFEELKSTGWMPDRLKKDDWVSFVNGLFSPAATWEDLLWLKTITKLPIVVKGILTGEGAREAVEAGADAVWVSNHGGRELDGVPASIDALREVVEAVGDRCEVYLDGGVRSGLDALKAIALGARAVFVGRPILWGLAYKGSEGVKNVLKILEAEFRTGLALLGASQISEILRGMVVHQSYYNSKL